MATPAANPRLAKFREAAYLARSKWLDRSWQNGPKLITKEEILGCIRELQTLDQEEQKAGLCNLRNLASIAARADVVLTDLALPNASFSLAFEISAVSEHSREQASLRQRMHEVRADSKTTIRPFVERLVRSQTDEERLKDPAYQFFERLKEPGSADVVETLKKVVAAVSSYDVTGAYAGVRDDDERDYEDGPMTVSGPPPKPLALAGLGLQLDGLGPSEAMRTIITAVEERKLKNHPTWRDHAAADAAASPTAAADGWENAVCSGLEKLIFCRLHSSLFGTHPKSASRDAKVAARLRSLGFLSFQHLDLPRDMPSWLVVVFHLAEACLTAMSSYKAPSDKVTCILNASNTLSTLLTFYYTEVKNKGKKGGGGSHAGAVGADDFLPSLIYALLRAAPPQLYSTLRYLGDFTRPSLLMSQRGYFLTSVFSAVSFLRQARPEQLSLTREAFEEGIQRATEEATVKNATQMNRALEVARRTRGASMMIGFQQQGGKGGTGDGQQGGGLLETLEEGEEGTGGLGGGADDSGLDLLNVINNNHSGLVVDEDGGFSEDSDEESSRGFGDEDDDDDDEEDGDDKSGVDDDEAELGEHQGERGGSLPQTRSGSVTHTPGAAGETRSQARASKTQQHQHQHQHQQQNRLSQRRLSRGLSSGALLAATGGASGGKIAGATNAGAGVGLISAVTAELNEEDSAALDGLLRPPSHVKKDNKDHHHHQLLSSVPSSASLLSSGSGAGTSVGATHVSVEEFRSMVAKLKGPPASSAPSVVSKPTTDGTAFVVSVFDDAIFKSHLKEACSGSTTTNAASGSNSGVVAQATSLLNRYQASLNKAMLLFDAATPCGFGREQKGKDIDWE
jgi:Vacuolar sorting protein 9 (VPS9) domain